MCLVVVAWQQHADLSLVVAGNRDEFHQRPTKALHFWPDKPHIAGGRDLQAAGTWLAISRGGRFATVTNYRDADQPRGGLRSRGHLVTGFLESTASPLEYLQGIDGSTYAGFNLLASDGDTLAWYSNRGGDARLLEPGIYGLSNALLDSPWHKVVSLRARMSTLVAEDRLDPTRLMRLLADREKAPAAEIKSSHLPFAMAHAISAPFIVLPDYGTRSSSVVLADRHGGWQIHERRFDPQGEITGNSRLQFDQV